ncbi:hypothetical protein LF1_00510 [Rubripirellula obstinata]|uniref:Lipoprotein n=1 Tax=Rubripirellula obstinata TaxID=406547 RepID=A0A5B1CDY8_9BACT|nr:hypothetical protein [Rubripirellula obstinata]KAA1257564.1 hypothetical protein LF1_00510 [Rubripirellula obstinata]
MRNTLLCLTAVLFSGCFNLEPKPFDDLRIAIVSNTLIQSASVTFPDETELTIPPDKYDSFRELFRTLAPIDRVVESPGLPGLPDYELMFFAAGNVANIDVMIADSKLIWTLGRLPVPWWRHDAISSCCRLDPI